VSLLGFLFTPIFQGLFLLLVGLYALTGNILGVTYNPKSSTSGGRS
jgi:hypothetical protein